MAMPKFRMPRFAWILLGLLVCLGAFWLTQSYWRPLAVRAGILAANAPPSEEHTEHAAHEDHAAATEVITISDQAKANIGLEVGPVTVGEYEQTVSIPAIVTERPGRTNRVVAAPLTGFVLDVFAVPGQAVSPGAPLFVLQLTSEDLVQAQSDFLDTLLALDVEKREIARLESIPEGAIPQTVVLDRKYEKEKLEGQLLAQRQALLLHGLSEKQIDTIAEERHLLREFLITAPLPHDETEPGHLSEEHPRLVSNSPENGGETSPGVTDVEHAYVVDELSVKKGQLINAGETLAVLADLSHLYIGGDAFERDAPALIRAAQEKWKVAAVMEQDRTQVIEGLNIAYVANEIDPESRTLRFYVDLPNEIINEAHREGNRVFPTWRFKPGQRMELRVPLDRWQNQIVLPVGAIAQDGPERYVFVQNGNSFRRQPVHVVYRGADSVVIRNDGSVYPGTHIAMDGAHQLQMALKNQAGGGIDPHAGHTH